MFLHVFSICLVNKDKIYCKPEYYFVCFTAINNSESKLQFIGHESLYCASAFTKNKFLIESRDSSLINNSLYAFLYT